MESGTLPSLNPFAFNTKWCPVLRNDRIFFSCPGIQQVGEMRDRLQSMLMKRCDLEGKNTGNQMYPVLFNAWKEFLIQIQCEIILT